MPQVRGLTARLHAKPGEHYEYDGFWAYRVEVYLPARGEQPEQKVLSFSSYEMMPPARFYTEVECQRALTAKVEHLMGLMHKIGGAKPGESFVMDLKSGTIRRLKGQP